MDPVLVGDVFYSRLFLRNPELRSLFRSDMRSQYRKLIDMLGILTARLDRLDALAEEMAVLAARHVSYGVKPEHYGMVGEALLWTLQQGFGRDWTPELEEAWVSCYQVLADKFFNNHSYDQT